MLHRILNAMQHSLHNIYVAIFVAINVAKYPFIILYLVFDMHTDLSGAR